MKAFAFRSIIYVHSTSSASFFFTLHLPFTVHNMPDESVLLLLHIHSFLLFLLSSQPHLSLTPPPLTIKPLNN